MNGTWPETTLRLIDNLIDELAARDPSYLARYPIAIPATEAIEALLASRGHEPQELLPAIRFGLERMRERGLPMQETAEGDGVGLVAVMSLADAALAGQGRVDLKPEPDDARDLAQIIEQDFETHPLPSGQRVIIAKGTGRPLLVINALGVPLSMWRHMLADKYRSFRPVFVENRCGTLFEGGMHSDIALTAHADDILAGLDWVGCERFDILGWCNGGRTAIEVARRVPNRVNSLVLLATTMRGATGVEARSCPYEDNLEKAFAKVRAKPAFAEPMAKMLGQLFSAVDWAALPDDEARAATFLSRPRAALATDLGRPMANGPFLQAYAARTAADEAYDLSQSLRDVTVPITLITGDRDAIVSNPHTIATLALRGPLSAISVLGAGHYVADLQYRYLRLLLERHFADPGRPKPTLCLRYADATRMEPPEWRYRPSQPGRDGTRYPLAQVYAFAAATAPHRIAVSDGDVSLTFATLETGAHRLAARLIEAGVQPGSHVVVLSEKRAIMPLIAGAIWKADAVYVPLDAENPVERLSGLFAQVGPRAIIGSEKALDKLRVAGLEPAPFCSFEDILVATDEHRPEAASLPEPAQDEDRPAYIIFTSGSTGTPKGVTISHRSLIDYFYNHNQVLRFNASSRVFSLAPFHFDVSIEDTILPLSLGAFVFQFRGLPVGLVMRRIMKRERITHLIAVSSLLALITEGGSDINRDSFPHLTMVMTGAESCDPRLIDLWVSRMPGTRVINAYGPTEATIVCLTYTIETPEPERMTTYPIGHPLPGVTTLILDEQDNPVTLPGTSGELLIGGSQVMLGYHARPEDTARVCPVIGGARYYRTGDICQIDEKGRIEFVGRTDDMVKIAGRRIHLGEIRHQALAIDGVRQAAVGTVAVNGRPGIGLAVVIDDISGPNIADIRVRLSRNLPAYMVPTTIRAASEARVTASGKTDEKALMRALTETIDRYGPTDGPLLADASIGRDKTDILEKTAS
jgi:D-alanine--poly(phosphoribitol) ligase subunit 1